MKIRRYEGKRVGYLQCNELNVLTSYRLNDFSIKRAFTLAEVFHSAEQSKRIAFTLAEVLITLGIIGVVAALTMPSLIQNYRKHAVVNKLRTDISLIQNAFKMAEAKHGTVNEWSFPSECLNNFLSGVCGEYVFETYIAPEIQILEKCYPISEKCWTPTKSLDGTKGYLHLEDAKINAVVLKNGSSIYFWGGGNLANNNMHLQIWFDIDGPQKGKNTLGADVFGIYLNFADAKTTLTGQGEDFDILLDEAHGCSKNSKGIYAGRYCAALIQYNGWTIPDDYPIKL